MPRTCTIVRKLAPCAKRPQGESLGVFFFSEVRNSYLTDHALRPYPARVTDTSRRSYFYGFFYYGFPLAGRDWRRTRE